VCKNILLRRQHDDPLGEGNCWLAKSVALIACAKHGSLYFESLATALVIAVFSQTDSRLPEAGNIYAQNERVQQALWV
jgi:hypothetical protein